MVRLLLLGRQCFIPHPSHTLLRGCGWRGLHHKRPWLCHLRYIIVGLVCSTLGVNKWVRYTHLAKCANRVASYEYSEVRCYVCKSIKIVIYVCFGAFVFPAWHVQIDMPMIMSLLCFSFHTLIAHLVDCLIFSHFYYLIIYVTTRC